MSGAGGVGGTQICDKTEISGELSILSLGTRSRGVGMWKNMKNEENNSVTEKWQSRERQEWERGIGLVFECVCV